MSRRSRGKGSEAARSYANEPMPAGDLPWREARYVVVDLETTGLDPRLHEIISFAAIPIEEGRVAVGRAQLTFIQPVRMPEAVTIRIHGLRPMDLTEAPPLEKVLDSILEALTGRVLVAHVAAVEVGFLGAALRQHGLRLRNPVVDTATLGAELRLLDAHETPHPIGLSGLARSLGLPVHRPHHADGDALTTAQVFVALAMGLDAREPQTVGSLQAAGGAPSHDSPLRAGLAWIRDRVAGG
jgi:DNA polymerase-3 subunit epsilon